MWLLDTSADVFHNRRLWLRPGRSYLFGRTDSEPGQICITHKTVSRKHLKISVGTVQDGDAHNLDKRSSLTLTDLGTKSGTTIDGHLIKGGDHVVQGDLVTFLVGRFEKTFCITWHPVICSFSFSAKELRADPMSKLRNVAEQLDIKLLADYDCQHTTHLVSKKRNTAKVLQALIDGKYIVSNEFLDAVATASASDLNQSLTSALEADFDGSWPNELDYLPPRSNEKSQCTTTLYRPNPARKNIFEGYTFILYDRTQFENLSSAINAGKGQALLHDVIPNKTLADDLVRYVKAVAGEKGLGRVEDGSKEKGVVVVRHTPAKGPDADWYRLFFETVSLRLDQRLIEQSEFLDAILQNQPAMLRRPLQLEDAAESQLAAPTPSPLAVATINPSDASPLARSRAAWLTRSGQIRRPVQKKFKGFDDSGDDMDSEVMAPTELPVSCPPDSIHGIERPSTHGLFVEQADQADSAEHGPDRQRRDRKRAASPTTGEPENIMDAIAPTAMARKRRRIATETEEQQIRQATPPPASGQNLSEGYTALTKIFESKPKSKGEPSGDSVIAALQKGREAEEALRQAENELSSSKVAEMTSVQLAAIRDLAIVENIDVVHGKGPSSGGIDSPRWEERWNGRKNFKRFRRQGETQAPRRPLSDFIQVVEAKPRKFGIGDNYWLQTSYERQSSVAHVSSHGDINIMESDHSIQSYAAPQGQSFVNRGRPLRTSAGSPEPHGNRAPSRTTSRQGRLRNAASTQSRDADSTRIRQTLDESPLDHASAEPTQPVHQEPDAPTLPYSLEHSIVSSVAPRATRSTRMESHRVPPSWVSTQASQPAHVGKRAASTPLVKNGPFKRQRRSPPPVVFDVANSDGDAELAGGAESGIIENDSDEEADSDGSIKFVFGKR